MEIIGILYSSVYIALFLLLFSRWLKDQPRALTASLFAIKIAFTFALQALFIYYYTDRSTADIYRFFDDGMLLRNVLFESPIDFLQIISGIGIDTPYFRTTYFEAMNAWIKPFDSGLYNDNHFMIRINALIGLISFGYYEVHGVIFSAMSFLGIWWIVTALLPSDTDRSLGFIFAILFPSSLLWLSGGLKETVLMLGIGATLQGLVADSVKQRVGALLLGGLILLSLKLYFTAALLPVLGIHYIDRRFDIGVKNSYLLWGGVILTGIGVSYMMGTNLLEYVVRKQHEFLNHVQEIKPGSTFSMPYIPHDLLSIAAYLPQALVNAMLRPFPWEVDSTAEVLMMVENILLLACLTGAIIGRRATATSSMIHACIQFILPIILLTGFVTPVFGAIMRYRAPVIVVLLIVLVPYIRQSLKRVNHTTS